MFGTRWRLFRVMGIPLYLDPSWLIILALLTVTVAEILPGFVRAYYPGLDTGVSVWAYWVAGFCAALGFFACIVLHELGHAVAARSQTMPTRGITLFLFGGVAELGDEPPSAWSEFLMAVAGPAVTVALVLALGAAASLGYHQGWPPLLVVTLGYLTVINAMVLVFNLIPAFPLDGGRVLRSILWAVTGSVRRATRWAAGVGRVFSWVLIAWGVVQFFAGNWVGGIWLGLIGWFLGSAARSGYARVLMRQALQGEPVRHFMNPAPISVPAPLTLREWVEVYVYRYHRKVFPVVSDAQLVGYIETKDLAGVPRSEWEVRTVADVMHRELAPIAIRSDAEALDALKRMRQTESARLLVVDDGQLVGILSLKDLLRYLALELEEQSDRSGAAPAGHTEPAA
jgi:Zn-dependent protease/CBS domain-containing protein